MQMDWKFYVEGWKIDKSSKRWNLEEKIEANISFKKQNKTLQQ